MKYCLVDASNLIYRARHVQEMHEAEEVVALCLHTAFMSMRKVFFKFGADHVVACFDKGSWRKALFEEYKAHRSENLTKKEEEIRESIYEVCDKFYEFLDQQTNVTALRETHIEADDFIARWIQTHPNDEHVIISTDHDFKQLVSENVCIFNGVMNQLITIDGVFFQDADPKAKYPRREMYGETWKQKLVKTKKVVTDEPVTVEPAWELFLKIMKGDVSDNIPAAHVPRYRTTKIREAFENPNGARWNEMMNMVRDTQVDLNTGEETEFKVKEFYELNSELVDLTKQPDEVKELMDDIISEKVSRDKVNQVGVKFIQYCSRNMLINLSEHGKDYGTMLAAGYTR